VSGAELVPGDVGAHAVELERRLHRAKAVLRIMPNGSGWLAWVTINESTYNGVGFTVSGALWEACGLAGLTKGMVP
jgi:hypothetical protein